MGIAKRGGHYLDAIYLNLSELNIRFRIKHSMTVTGKLIEIKKITRKPFHQPTRNIKHQVTRPFATNSSNACIGYIIRESLGRRSYVHTTHHGWLRAVEFENLESGTSGPGESGHHCLSNISI